MTTVPLPTCPVGLANLFMKSKKYPKKSGKVRRVIWRTLLSHKVDWGYPCIFCGCKHFHEEGDTIRCDSCLRLA